MILSKRREERLRFTSLLFLSCLKENQRDWGVIGSKRHWKGDNRLNNNPKESRMECALYILPDALSCSDSRQRLIPGWEERMRRENGLLPFTFDSSLSLSCCFPEFDPHTGPEASSFPVIPASGESSCSHLSLFLSWNIRFGCNSFLGNLLKSWSFLGH